MSHSVQAHIFKSGDILSNRYRIDKLIGSGGMGAIYKAYDQKEEREVALKVLHKEYAKDKVYLKRFRLEVEAMQKVSHQNVIKVFDYVEEEDKIYFSMEHIDGSSLEEVLDEKRFNIKLLSKIIIEVTKGLSAIHSVGVIHRDLKPGNILITKDSVVKIVDFGVVKTKESKLTAKNLKVGSVCYMAPEVWKGKKLTSAIDYYSFGIMLYEMCTGKVPFDHVNPLELMKMHLEAIPIPPSHVNIDVPIWVNELIEKLLGKNPKKRLTDPDEIVQMVQKNDPNYEVPEEFKKVFSLKVHEPEEREKVIRGRKRQPTVVFSLDATRPSDPGAGQQILRPRRRTTITLQIPKRAALVFEFEMPSRDFIYLGIFLLSLNIFDWYLTRMGVERYGTLAEGNFLLRNLMENFGPNLALTIVKGIAIALVLFLTYMARRARFIKDIITFLSVVYLFAAIIPWVYILFVKDIINL